MPDSLLPLPDESLDLIGFVTARLDEDETSARAAAAGGRWRYEDGDAIGAWALYDEHWNIASLKTYRHETYDYAERMPTARNPEYVDANANGRHIARHDPARVLREVKAKRRLLKWAQDRLHDFEDFPADEAYHLDAIEVLRIHLPLLAAPYADHPSFRPEWSPSAN
jgi:hypothetical protein